MGSNSKQNISRVKSIDALLAVGDYEGDGAFFFRATGAGNIKYLPANNPDDEPITKAVEASSIFNDPEYCRKIFKIGTTATGIHVGFGF